MIIVKLSNNRILSESYAMNAIAKNSELKVIGKKNIEDDLAWELIKQSKRDADAELASRAKLVIFENTEIAIVEFPAF